MVNRPKPCLSLPFKPPCQYSRPQNKIYSSQISFYTYHTNESDLSNQGPKSLDTTRLGAMRAFISQTMIMFQVIFLAFFSRSCIL